MRPVTEQRRLGRRHYRAVIILGMNPATANPHRSRFILCIHTQAAEFSVSTPYDQEESRYINCTSVFHYRTVCRIPHDPGCYSTLRVLVKKLQGSFVVADCTHKPVSIGMNVVTKDLAFGYRPQLLHSRRHRLRARPGIQLTADCRQARPPTHGEAGERAQSVAAE